MTEEKNAGAPAKGAGEGAAPPAPQEKPKGMAVAAMVTGIAGLALAVVPCTWWLGLPVSIVGVVLSLLARSKISAGVAEGSGLALAGLICGILGAVVGIIYLLVIMVFVSQVPGAFEQIQDELQKEIEKAKEMKDSSMLFLRTLPYC